MPKEEDTHLQRFLSRTRVGVEQFLISERGKLSFEMQKRPLEGTRAQLAQIHPYTSILSLPHVTPEALTILARIGCLETGIKSFPARF